MAFIETPQNDSPNLKEYTKREKPLDNNIQKEYCYSAKNIRRVNEPCFIEKGSPSFNLNDEIQYSISLQDLEKKRLELITLQKSITSLWHSQQKQKRLAAKLLKLALDSKIYVAIPQIKSTSEFVKKINLQNKLVESQICSMSSFDEQHHLSYDQDDEVNASYTFRKANESLYKIFLGRHGHLKGENKPLFIILSSEALYIKDTESQHENHKVLYEDIRVVYVGENHRWISVATRSVDSTKELQFRFQVELSDPATTRSILRHLELAARRRWIVLSNSLRNKRRMNSTSFSLPVYAIMSERSISLPVHANFSFGRWVELLLPQFISCSTFEVAYIEDWLMKALKVNKKPRVLACWLVFWENGSEVRCAEDAQVDRGPRMNGFLMVDHSQQRNSWTPAYFLLKGGILYQFRDDCDEFPQSVIKVREFCGCRRLLSDSRPYAFELLGKNGNSVSFAAPNEDVASLWLQAFLRLISAPDDYSKEIRRLKPCQVIQTTEALVLSYQKDFLTAIKSKSTRKKSLPVSNATDTSTKISSTELEETTCLKHLSTARNVASDPSKKLQDFGSYSLSGYGQDKSPSVAACPPTPPLPEFESTFKVKNSEDEENNEECLQLLTSCNLYQISEIFVTSWATNGCYLELECSEAGDFAGDWVLYFPTENMLSSFLKLVKECRECITDETTGLTKVSQGRLNDILLEGAVMSKSFWNPCKTY